MVLELLTGNVSSCSSHLILAHVITITTWREKHHCPTGCIWAWRPVPLGESWEKWSFARLRHMAKLWPQKALSSCPNSLNLPKPTPLSGRAMPVPYVLTGDDAFDLTRLSKAQRILNKLSRMRRISENCFGIFVNRWKVFRALILLPPDTVVDLIWQHWYCIIFYG